MIFNTFLNGYPLCELTLVKNNKDVKVNCIIDTGSPYTIIPQNAVDELIMSKEDQFTEVTIHGIIHKEECSVDVPGYEIDIVIGDTDFENSTIFCYQFMKNYGLLGQNILRQCKLIIDWEQNTIILEKN